MMGTECDDCGHIESEHYLDSCPTCGGYMRLVDFDDDPVTRALKVHAAREGTQHEPI